MSRFTCLALFGAMCVLAAACGDGDDGAPIATSQSQTPEVTPTSTIVTPLVPPLEGPERELAATERTDFWEDPAYALPDPEVLSAPPTGSDDPILSPPEPSACPDGWGQDTRVSEGFAICYPGDWKLAGQGNVLAGQEDTWFSVGIVDFANEEAQRQRAHVSIYVVPRYAKPFLYTKNCPEPYSVTFAGEPAVVCADFPTVSPEANIASYHIRHDERDYFVQIVPYYEYNEATGAYTDEITEKSLATAIEIAFTFRLVEPPTPLNESPSGS